MFSTFQAHQPISLTGALRHAFLWTTSGFTGKAYKNPSFKPTLENPKGAVLYCVHGTADRVSAFSLIANRLLVGLSPSISSIRLCTFTARLRGTSIEDYALQLQEEILANGDEQVFLAGHSRGVLIALLAALNLEANNKIKVSCVFSIAGPLGGSAWALPPLSLLSSSVYQMRIESHFLKELKARIKASSLKIIYFSAANDSLVSLKSSYLEEKCHANIVLERHGHLSIMSSHKLLVHLHKYINEFTLNKNQVEVLEAAIPILENNDFIIIDNDEILSPLIEPYNEIDMLIAELKIQNYMIRETKKIQVLEGLRNSLLEIMQDDKKADNLSEITVGKYIKEFLQKNNYHEESTTGQYIENATGYAYSFFKVEKLVSVQVLFYAATAKSTLLS